MQDHEEPSDIQPSDNQRQMMKQHTIRYIMIGGFLGAGKTTTLARLAGHYTENGLNVAIVTNDQTEDLVDTHMLRSLGFNVGEVAGACFCCNFDELISTMDGIEDRRRPDVILAEPVGSCTDLVATVIQPLKDLYNARFEIAPYAVILKPSHGRRILRNEPQSGFSPKASYILKKQLEEADAILINRVDELSEEEICELESLVKQHCPDRPILRISAKSGIGFGKLTELLETDGEYGHRILDIDYDIYAAGEAELGWLNASITVTAAEPFALDDLLLDLISVLRERFAAIGAEAAHLKAIGLWEGFFGVANLISSENAAELSLPSNCSGTIVDIVVNARVAIDPESLRDLVESTIHAVCHRRAATAELRRTNAFRPGRPVPVHRYTSARKE